MICCGEGQSADRLQSSDKTTLTEVFAYNTAAAAAPAVEDRDDDDDDEDDGHAASDADVALSLLYPDFPTHFTWNETRKRWKPRQRRAAQPQVGRICSAHPGYGERYYVRLLPCHIQEPVSFEALRTFPDRTVAETFQEACRSRGLLADDLKWSRCQTEAVSHQTCTAALRELLVTILRHGNIGYPLSLWQGHRDSLAGDFLHQARATDPSRAMCNEFHSLALLLHIDAAFVPQGPALWTTAFHRLSTLPRNTCHTRSSRSWPGTATTSCGNRRTRVLAS